MLNWKKIKVTTENYTIIFISLLKHVFSIFQTTIDNYLISWKNVQRIGSYELLQICAMNVMDGMNEQDN